MVLQKRIKIASTTKRNPPVFLKYLTLFPKDVEQDLSAISKVLHITIYISCALICMTTPGGKKNVHIVLCKLLSMFYHFLLTISTTVLKKALKLNNQGTHTVS